MARQSCDTRMLEEGSMDRGNILFGGHEALYCGCIACASEGNREPGGTYAVNTLLANIYKQTVTRFPYEISPIAQDIAGGLTESMHGAGSPQAQRIMISRLVNIEEKKRAAKKLCTIKEG